MPLSGKARLAALGGALALAALLLQGALGAQRPLDRAAARPCLLPPPPRKPVAGAALPRTPQPVRLAPSASKWDQMRRAQGRADA